MVTAGPGTVGYIGQLPTKSETAAAKAARQREAAKLRAEQEHRSNQIRLAIQVVISLAVLGGALFIILSQLYDPKDKHWAYGSAGTILGYWLKK